MADEATQPDTSDPFAGILSAPAVPAMPAAPVASAPQDEPPEGADPFASYGDLGRAIAPPTTAFHAAEHAAERGVAPALTGWAAFAAGAEATAPLGELAGPYAPLAVPVAGFVGGVASAIGASWATSSAQGYALSKAPDSWKDALGQDDRTRTLEAEQHPYATFLGGLVPNALTMTPFAASGRVLPSTATTLERLLNNPKTGRLFSGAALGTMELAQEMWNGETPDWAKVGTSTAFGMVFARPNGIGETISRTAARPWMRGPEGQPIPTRVPDEPTISDAADMQVMGPGVTESVFQGTAEQDPVALESNRAAAQVEQSIIGEPPAPDLHGIARRMEPELFEAYDALSAQREQARAWIAEFQNPPEEQFDALKTQKDAIDQQLADHVEQQKGYTGGKEARRLRAQSRDLQSQIDTLQARRDAYGNGEAPETSELAAARKRLMDADYAMRDMAEQVSAAYRRAADAAGSGTVEPVPHEAPETVPETPSTDAAIESVFAPPAQGTAPTRSVTEQRAAIAADVKQKLVAAGRPEDEADAAAQVYAAQYVTRAQRFKGALGTPEELHAAEGARIQDGDSTKASGKIRLVEGKRPIITLTKDANASTFIHESGHEFLEQLMRDADHEAAPDDLKADAQTVRKWVGAEDGVDIKTRQHEKFARGFEQYLREGVAPSPELAGVFGRFKQWLVQIYQTLKGLGAPINDDIRGVFDRMLALEPKRTVIALEAEPRPDMAATHTADAEKIEPHEADAATDRVAAEKTAYIESQPPEIRNELETALAKVEAANAANGAGEGAAGTGGPGEVVAGSGIAGPDASGGGGSTEPGRVEPVATAAGAEGPGVPAGPDVIGERSKQLPALAPGARPSFAGGAERLIDKAGNIRVENLTTREDVAEAIRDAAEANDNFIGDRRGVITDGDVLNLAEALGMDARQLSARKLGQAFNAEQVMAARKLLIQSATHVADLMKKAATGSDEDVMAYAEARDRHQMIQAQVAGITAEAGRALRAFRDISASADAQAADQFLRQATGKTLFQLREEARLGAQLDTPEQVSRFMQDATKPSFGRMLLEYFINNLISGPATHTTYVIGNTLLTADRILVETPVAAAIGKLRGREGVGLREVAGLLQGARRGLSPALTAMLDSLRTGQTTLLPTDRIPAQLPGTTTNYTVAAHVNEAATLHDVGNAFGAMLQGMRDGIRATGALASSPDLFATHYVGNNAIPDFEIRGVGTVPLGSVLRMPSRGVAAIHSFFRTVNYSIEKNGLAFREAANNPVAGQSFEARAADLYQNPTEAIMNQAAAGAANLTLMQQGGTFVKALGKLINVKVNLPILGETQPLKFIDPFIHIAANIMDQSLVQRTPIGVLSAEIRADLMGRNGPAAADMAAAKMLTGTALGLTFVGLAAQGLASGSGPTDPRQSAMWRLAGNQPHSVRIGDMWYDVHRLGPLGMLAGVAADLYDVGHAIGTEDASKVAAMLMHSFTQNILDESFMRGPADLIKALEDSDRYGAAYARNFLSSFVPFSVGMAQMDRASDPYTRQARTVMDAIKAKIPGLSETLFPKRDVWGQEIPNLEALGHAGLTAIYMRQISADPVNIAMLQLNIAPAPVLRKIRNVDLTDQQYDDYARLAGRMVKQRLDTIVTSPDFQTWPPYVRTQVIEETIRQSREVAGGVMMSQYPEIAKQATAAKLAKVRGPAAAP